MFVFDELNKPKMMRYIVNTIRVRLHPKTSFASWAVLPEPTTEQLMSNVEVY